MTSKFLKAISLSLLLAITILNSQTVAFAENKPAIKSLDARINESRLSNQLTLRSFLATAVVGKAQNEINGVIEFLKELKINLDQPIDLQVKGEKVFIFKREFSYDLQTNKFTYDGTTYKGPSPGAIDSQIREIFNRIKPEKSASLIELFFPKAQAADKVAVAINNVTNAGAVAAIAGWFIEGATKERFWVLASRYLVRGGVSAFVGGLILGCLWPSEAGASELVMIEKAYCDKNGLKVSTNGPKAFEVKLVNGQPQISINGVVADSESEKFVGKNAGTAKELLASCAKEPISPSEFKSTLQRAIDQKYKMDVDAVMRKSAATGKASPAGSSK